MDLQHLRLPEWLPLDWLPLEGEAKAQAALVLLALALAAACLLLGRALSGFTAGTARWLRVAVGTRSVPEAPGGLPLLGHALSLATAYCPWEKMLEWARQKGPLTRFSILYRTGLIVNDPAGAKRVFQTGQRLYDKDLDFSYKPFLSILGTGLVTANGAHWQKQRLLMAPALRIDMLDAIIPIAKVAVERLCKQMESYRGTNQPVDMEEEFRLLTLQIIGEAILSLPPDECDRVFPHLYLPVMEENNRRVLAPWRQLYPVTAWQYNRKVKQLNDYIIGIIRARRAARAANGGKPPAKPDILDRVLTAAEESGDKWTAASEVQLCYEVKTFLLAGHETSSAMLCWSMYELSRNAGALGKVRAEAEAVYGTSAPRDAMPDRDGVDSMEYTHSVLKEALRKYSVVPVVTRNLNSDDELLGHRIPKGSWLIIHVQGIHHQYKEPMAFRPERFMPGGEYEQFPEDIRPYYFLPFIQGPRNCLGQYFALLEARVILSTLCQRFTFRPVDAEKQGETHPSVIPIAPKHGMRMYVS
ncbi:Cytochrome P450 [Chlorella sorokiniana]|uniref:Cytochrome P450 n=1 Tax=Chlorella sorokiniana TaxID=3076 RepID=A0A2P6THW0_CHLSO|nr:Cytochrome P450 [Chlorella sorokiniana]|eukprot:PRW33867.1 Cytochrome P450 [Chlorella sorokiniana]